MNSFFDLKIQDMSDVFCMQYDFCEGYCIGTIAGHDGLYLICQKTQTAKRLPEEYQKVISKVVADSCNKLGEHIYHFECQSTKDGTIMIRMMEYDFMIALANSKWHRNKKRLKLPRSCIIYLRTQDTSMKEDTLEIELQDGNVVRYKVPILMVRNYSIEEIFEKRLLILLPYYIIKYEKELSAIAGNEARLQALEQEYRYIIYRLEQMTKEDNTALFKDMMQMIRRVMDYILRKNEDVEERMADTMGGKVMWLPSDELKKARNEGIECGIEQGIERGIEQGIEQGELENSKKMFKKCLKRGDSKQEAMDFAEIDQALADELYEEFLNEQ